VLVARRTIVPQIFQSLRTDHSRNLSSIGMNERIRVASSAFRRARTTSVKCSPACFFFFFFFRDSPQTGRRITADVHYLAGDASRAMTARYRRQVLMSLVHQLSYRPLGEVSNIGVTEAGWRFSNAATNPAPTPVPSTHRRHYRY